MNKLIISFLLLSLPFLVACHQKNPAEPPKENIHPQVDIPWPSLANSPWPMHHHDPQSTGRTTSLGPRQGTVVWKFNVNGPVGTSVAIGPDSTIYFASSYDTTEGRQMPYIYALNWNGTIKWKFRLRTNILFADPSQSCSPLVAADGTIYIGSRDCQIYAINSDGTLKWTFKADDDVYSISLTIGLDGTIYFTAADNYLYAVNPNGTLKWKSESYYRFLCSPTAGIAFSPDGAALYLGYSGTAESDTNYGLAAVNLNGQVKWAFKTGFPDGTPLVDNQGNIYFGAGRGVDSPDSGRTGVFSLNSDGHLRWKYLSDRKNNFDLTMDYNGNIYFDAEKESKFWIVSCDNDGYVRWE